MEDEDARHGRFYSLLYGALDLAWSSAELCDFERPAVFELDALQRPDFGGELAARFCCAVFFLLKSLTTRAT